MAHTLVLGLLFLYSLCSRHPDLYAAPWRSLTTLLLLLWCLYSHSFFSLAYWQNSCQWAVSLSLPVFPRGRRDVSAELSKPYIVSITAHMTWHYFYACREGVVMFYLWISRTQCQVQSRSQGFESVKRFHWRKEKITVREKQGKTLVVVMYRGTKKSRTTRPGPRKW